MNTNEFQIQRMVKHHQSDLLVSTAETMCCISNIQGLTVIYSTREKKLATSTLLQVPVPSTTRLLITTVSVKSSQLLSQSVTATVKCRTRTRMFSVVYNVRRSHYRLVLDNSCGVTRTKTKKNSELQSLMYD